MEIRCQFGYVAAKAGSNESYPVNESEVRGEAAVTRAGDPDRIRPECIQNGACLHCVLNIKCRSAERYARGPHLLVNDRPCDFRAVHVHQLKLEEERPSCHRRPSRPLDNLRLRLAQGEEVAVQAAVVGTLEDDLLHFRNCHCRCADGLDLGLVGCGDRD